MTPALAQAVEKKVALKHVGWKPPQYARMIPKVGLKVTGTDVTHRHVFTLVDTNGGELAEGDVVLIKYGDGSVTYWVEGSGGEITRNKNAGENAKFKIKKAAKGISLQAESGKFVTAENPDTILNTTDSPEKAAVFAVIENPAVKEEPKK